MIILVLVLDERWNSTQWLISDGSVPWADAINKNPLKIRIRINLMVACLLALLGSHPQVEGGEKAT